MAFKQGSTVFLMRSPTICSNFALDLSILHGLQARINSFLDEISYNLFKLCPG